MGSELEDPKIQVNHVPPYPRCVMSISIDLHSPTSQNSNTQSSRQMGLKTPTKMPTKKWVLNHLPLKEFDDTCSKISFPVFVFYIFKMSKYKYCFHSHYF